MKILVVSKYPPIQGGVSSENFWLVQQFVENGHQVKVLTNAHEVEEDFRISLQPADESKLRGFRKLDSIEVHSTEIDPKHVFIPQTNPSLSKLVTKGIELVRTFQPDFIYSSYLEPYGVAAYFLALIFGIPYTVRHAGSDLHRLLPTPGLFTLYSEVLKNATAILTSTRAQDQLIALGVQRHRLLEALSTRLPGDVFFPSERIPGSILTGGVYGKTGPAKGTQQILDACQLLRTRQEPLLVRAHWGGREIDRIVEFVERRELSSQICVEPYIAPWRMGDFIRSCDFILALENNFRINSHSPSLPLEAWACGRRVILTEELAEKPHILPFIEEDSNCIVIPKEFDAEILARSMIGMKNIILSSPDQIRCFDAGLASLRLPEKAESLISQIAELSKI